MIFGKKMDEFYDARKKMVKEQLVKRGIKNQQVLDTMLKVQRHLFVDSKNIKKAYSDSPLPINCSQTISQPYIVALMTELIEPDKNKRVLEIGTGSGYHTAILAELFKKIFSVERHKTLADKAEKKLKSLGYKNIEIKAEDGSVGWKDKSPYDAIIITAAAPEVPDILVEQLKDRGKMVIPVGSHFQQNLELICKRGDSYITKIICGCVFVPLIGKAGWKV